MSLLILDLLDKTLHPYVHETGANQAKGYSHEEAHYIILDNIGHNHTAFFLEHFLELIFWLELRVLAFCTYGWLQFCGNGIFWY